jgi:hypothetical protein
MPPGGDEDGGGAGGGDAAGGFEDVVGVVLEATEPARPPQPRVKAENRTPIQIRMNVLFM